MKYGICKLCGKPFVSKYNKTVYCSKQCGDISKQTKYKRAAKKVNLTQTEIDNGYINIRAGIIEQAVEDYRTALVCNDSGAAAALERWFLSDWGQALSENNGVKIIERVRKECGKGGEK